MTDHAIPVLLADLVRSVHHVAIAVPNLEEALALYRDQLGFEADEPEVVGSQGVRVSFVFAGPNRIELVEPTTPTSAIARFLEKRGSGLHHVAFEVDDVRRAIAVLVERGAQMIDQAPRPGAHHTLVAFVHPKSMGGVLTELVELPTPPA